MENKIKKCKNYNIITNCEFLDDDLFSKKLIEFYKKAVLKASDFDSLEKISKYDRVMRRYVEDYNFSKKLRNSVDVSSIISSKIDLTDAVLDYVLEFYTKYDDKVEEPVVNTRWI